MVLAGTAMSVQGKKSLRSIPEFDSYRHHLAQAAPMHFDRGLGAALGAVLPQGLEQIGKLVVSPDRHGDDDFQCLRLRLA